MKNVNAIFVRDLSEIPDKVSEVMRNNGKKPIYMVINNQLHIDILESKDKNAKTKDKRVVKYKGMSVIVTL